MSRESRKFWNSGLPGGCALDESAKLLSDGTPEGVANMRQVLVKMVDDYRQCFLLNTSAPRRKRDKR